MKQHPQIEQRREVLRVLRNRLPPQPAGRFRIASLRRRQTPVPPRNPPATATTGAPPATAPSFPSVAFFQLQSTTGSAPRQRSPSRPTATAPVTRSTLVAAPSPKCSRRSFCERKLDWLSTGSVCLLPPASIVTTAPIADRFDFTPSSTTFDPMRRPRERVPQQRRRFPHVHHRHIDVAIVVEIAERRARGSNAAPLCPVRPSRSRPQTARRPDSGTPLAAAGRYSPPPRSNSG